MPKKNQKSEDVIDAEFEPVDEPAPAKEQKPPRKRAAWPLVWSLFFFSILFGGGLGAAIAVFAMPKIKPNTELSTLPAQLQTLATQNQDQNQQIATLVQQITDLQERPIAANPDTNQISLAIAQLGQRLDTLEARPILVSDETGAQPSIDLAPILTRISQLETATTPTIDVSQFAKISDLSDISAVTATLEARILALENAPAPVATTKMDAEQLGALEQRFAALEARKDNTRSKARQAMAVADLKLAAQGEAPFAVAFAKARLQFASSVALDQLGSIAGTGAPNLASLSEQLTALIPLLLSQANKPAKDASLTTKAGAAIRSLVSVRRTDGKGDGLQAQLSIAESRLQAADLAGAIQILEKVDGAAAQTAAPWLQNAKNRQQINQSLFLLAQEQVKGDAP